MLTAYQVGVEVESKIAEAINPRHYDTASTPPRPAARSPPPPAPRS